VGPHSRVLALTTFCFDISVLEMFLPLFRGGALVLAEQATQKNPFRLLDVIKNTGVTVMQATPTTFEMLLATGWKGDHSIDFLIGGEAFRPTLLPLVGNCKSIRNVYGPTETTIWSSSYTLPNSSHEIAMAHGTPVIPIGTPISETVFYIVSESEESPKRLVEDGREGELWIGGIGVAQGYLHAPELTKDRFLQDPFGGVGFVYRTGDIVRRAQATSGKRSNEDKSIESSANTREVSRYGEYVFVRRMDDQVKIDGFRIELAEIENVFAGHPLVDKAVAVVRNGKLVLYVRSTTAVAAVSGRSEPHRSALLNDDELKDMYSSASRSLTYYMLPK
jgi:surfactin family lipopeptide synthetase A